MNSLPYDVVIDQTGIWYGPAGTIPKSRDWQCFGNAGYDVISFFQIVTREDFDLNVTTWRVRVYTPYPRYARVILKAEKE